MFLSFALTGQALLTSFLDGALETKIKYAAPYVVGDYIYSNPGICPRLGELQDEIHASPEFLAEFNSHAGARNTYLA